MHQLEFELLCEFHAAPLARLACGDKSSRPQLSPVQPGSHLHLPSTHSPAALQSSSVEQVVTLVSPSDHTVTMPPMERRVRNTSTLHRVPIFSGYNEGSRREWDRERERKTNRRSTPRRLLEIGAGIVFSFRDQLSYSKRAG
eukprot:scpid75872/ scgid14631/ 